MLTKLVMRKKDFKYLFFTFKCIIYLIAMKYIFLHWQFECNSVSHVVYKCLNRLSHLHLVFSFAVAVSGADCFPGLLRQK